MAQLQWHFVNKADYLAGETQEGHIYFISDTGEIYRGTANGAVSFTESVGLYTDADHLPATPALNRIYFNKKNLEGKIFNGTQWITVIKPVEDTIDDASGNPVSGTAVAAYVADEIEKGLTSAVVVSEVSYDKNNKSITVTKGNNSTTTLVMEGLATNLVCSSANNKSVIQLLDVNNNPIGDTIELDVERFITSAEYDPTTKSIILYFDGKTGDESEDKIVIPVGDLVDTYTVESTDSVDLSMVNNAISAAVKISAAAKNVLVLKSDGLYVEEVDTSGFMLKVPGAVEGNVPVFDANGMLVDSGKTFAEVTGDVSALQDDVNELKETVISKDKIKTAADVAQTSDQASDENLVSEKLFVTSMEWKTTM